MKCEINSRISYNVLISNEIIYKSYKEICSGEKKKVNLAHLGNWGGFKVENNSMVHIPRKLRKYVHGIRYSAMPYGWEVFSKFFSFYNIEPNWLHCDFTYGHYDEDLGGWTGCLGMV